MSGRRDIGSYQRTTPRGHCQGGARVADSMRTLMQTRTTANTPRPAWFSAANAASLAERGFTLVHDICTPVDLAVLRAELPALFERRARSREGKF